MSNGKERGKSRSTRRELVDGFARRLALADSNYERTHLVRRMLNELRSLDNSPGEHNAQQQDSSHQHHARD